MGYVERDSDFMTCVKGQLTSLKANNAAQRKQVNDLPCKVNLLYATMLWRNDLF